MKKLNTKDIKKIESKKISYDEVKMFLHCKICLDKFFKSAEYLAGENSPHDAMSAEASSYLFKYPDGEVANIITIWCKRCNQIIWDSRHLTHKY